MKIPGQMKAIFDILRKGINIIGTVAGLAFADQRYLHFIGITEEETLDRPLRKSRPSTWLPRVLRTEKLILHAQSRRWRSSASSICTVPPVQWGRADWRAVSNHFLDNAFNFREEREQYERQNRQVMRRINQNSAAQHTFGPMFAVGENIKAAKDLAWRTVATDAPVLLATEGGTGMKLYTQVTHNKRSSGGCSW